METARRPAQQGALAWLGFGRGASSGFGVNDAIGIVGGIVFVTSCLIATVSSFGHTASLGRDGGALGVTIAVVGGVATLALCIPRSRVVSPLWLCTAALATGATLGSRVFLSGVGYGSGWWLGLLGGAALIYGWGARVGGG